jgi:hypothetical protein
VFKEIIDRVCRGLRHMPDLGVVKKGTVILMKKMHSWGETSFAMWCTRELARLRENLEQLHANDAPRAKKIVLLWTWWMQCYTMKRWYGYKISELIGWEKEIAILIFFTFTWHGELRKIKLQGVWWERCNTDYPYKDAEGNMPYRKIIPDLFAYFI